MREVERKIYFYRIEFFKNSSKVRPKPVFDYIDSLPYDVSGRHLQLPNGNERCLYVDSRSVPIMAQIGTRRKGDLPVVERAGQRRPVQLSTDEALLECTHFIIFPDDVMGMEYNQFAPRAGGLVGYLMEKARLLVDDVRITPLAKKDILEDLKKAQQGEIIVLKLRLACRAIPTLIELDSSLHKTFKTLEETAPGAYDLEVVLRAPKYSDRGFKASFLSRMPSWLSRPGVLESVGTARIKVIDPDGEREEIDLLRHYIMTTKKVVKQRDDLRSVDSRDMYSKIQDAYAELRPQIDSSIK